MKNYKDFLHKKLTLTQVQSNLEEVSPWLTKFNFRGVELPGQHYQFEGEPLPQHTIFVSRFEPNIFRNGIQSKKIAIKGSNSKIYGFTVQQIPDQRAVKEKGFQKFLAEERTL